MGKEKQPYKEIPTGTGRESEPKETLPAIEVDNEVEWVNPEFKEMPFNLKEGESTKLGVFLTPEPKEKEEVLNLKVAMRHRRSGLLGRAIFKDNQDRLYRDIDLKGVGWVFPKAFSSSVGKVEPRDEITAQGIFNLTRTLQTKEMAEEFLKAGIRTERYLAIIRLNEIVDEKGEKISIAEARKRKMINPNQEPVIALRALGTKFRVGDANTKNLEDARKLVAQELGIKEEDFSWKDYMEWFAKTAGENLGLMHNNDWYHNYLTGHNITLDCRIVDLDSVTGLGSMEKKEKEKKMERDYEELNSTIEQFQYDNFQILELELGIGSRIGSREKLNNIFNQSYKKTLSKTPEFLKKAKTKKPATSPKSK